MYVVSILYVHIICLFACNMLSILFVYMRICPLFVLYACNVSILLVYMCMLCPSVVCILYIRCLFVYYVHCLFMCVSCHYMLEYLDMLFM